MQLKQTLSDLFHLDIDGFIICTGINYKTIIKPARYKQSLEIFCRIVNGLGQLSANSQGLRQIITNVTKFSGTNQRIYIKTVGTQAVGFVKAGQKNLFYHNYIGEVKQLQPTCILDIYVHESCQRSGFGKQIFQKFLKSQNTIPQKLAYDRPSPKLISFLKKHYQLTQFVPQNNNYVIYTKYFTTQPTSKPKINNILLRQKTQIKKQKQNTQTQPKQSINKIKLQQITSPINEIKQIKTNKIVDSLQIMKQQVEKSKNSNKYIPTVSPINSGKFINYQGRTYTNMDKYQILNSGQSNGRYSLNMKIQDLSFRLPWATQNQQEQNINFRTTSNTYGNHYRR